MIVIRVTGDPQVKGSAKAFVAGGRAIITNDCKKEKPWAQRVHWAAKEQAPPELWDGPIRIEIEFRLPRPGRLGKKRVDVYSDRRPDGDKLTRSVCDALTGVIFTDDARISEYFVRKLYANFGQPTGCTIMTRRLVEAPPIATAAAAQQLELEGVR